MQTLAQRALSSHDLGEDDAAQLELGDGDGSPAKGQWPNYNKENLQIAVRNESNVGIAMINRPFGNG